MKSLNNTHIIAPEQWKGFDLKIKEQLNPLWVLVHWIKDTIIDQVNDDEPGRK